MKIEHTWQRFCPEEYRPNPIAGLWTLCLSQIPLHTIFPKQYLQGGINHQLTLNVEKFRSMASGQRPEDLNPNFVLRFVLSKIDGDSAALLNSISSNGF